MRPGALTYSVFDLLVVSDDIVELLLGLVSQALLLISVLSFVVLFHQCGKNFAERGQLIVVHNQEQVNKNLRLMMLDEKLSRHIFCINIVGKVTDLKRSGIFLLSGRDLSFHKIELLHVLANSLVFLDH